MFHRFHPLHGVSFQDLSGDQLSEVLADALPSLHPILRSHMASGRLSLFQHEKGHLYTIAGKIIDFLGDYRIQHDIDTVVIGLSGGADSALTATLFRESGWKVRGMALPIHQMPEHTQMAQDFADWLKPESFEIVDLTDTYDHMVASPAMGLAESDPIARGNARARLRMIRLFHEARSRKGLVASTDNFSEWAMGFWTLHGDVGNIGPIQSLGKAYEVPAVGEILGIPDAFTLAVPTDGLGISSTDEDQFGFTYLQLDAFLSAAKNYAGGEGVMRYLNGLQDWSSFYPIAQDNRKVIERLKATNFKRNDPVNLDFRERITNF